MKDEPESMPELSKPQIASIVGIVLTAAAAIAAAVLGVPVPGV